MVAVKLNFFSTRTGQIFVAAMLMVLGLYLLITFCLAVNLAVTLDQVQLGKQNATVGTGSAGIILSFASMVGGATWLGMIAKKPATLVSLTSGEEKSS